MGRHRNATNETGCLAALRRGRPDLNGHGVGEVPTETKAKLTENGVWQCHGTGHFDSRRLTKPTSQLNVELCMD